MECDTPVKKRLSIKTFKVAFSNSNTDSKCLSAQRSLSAQIFAKRASKIIVRPQEILLLSFSIGTFLTNYDVICRKVKHFVTDENEQNGAKEVNGDYSDTGSHDRGVYPSENILEKDPQ